MAEKLYSYDDSEEEDYIDMEVGSYKALFGPSISSEFEFQMFSRSSEEDTTTSPADELFYKGNLLPLHLPPRLRMVEKLLQDKHKENFEEFFSTPLATNTNTTPISNTPFESCNVSPAHSCHVSRELNPEEYSLERNESVVENTKKSWKRKLKLTKQSSFGSKIKASKEYLKSFFSKSASCSVEAIPKVKDSNRTTVVKSSNKHSGHRRSFSGAIKRFTTTKSSSSLSSSDSNSSHEMQLQNKSIDRSSEIENLIQSAIAHCKRSQQQHLHSRKTISDIGLCSLAASRIACEDQERQVLCRG